MVRGFAWNSAEKIGSALFQIYVSIKVINRIVPDDYSVFAILLAFTAVFNSFVDSGFSQALIRKTNPSQNDFSSAFWFNTGISIVVYGLLVALSYPAAGIFGMPELTGFAPVFYLVVPLGALNIIQQTVLVRNFDFGRLSAVNFASTVGSGIIAVLLALYGWGVWALIWQRIAQVAIRGLLLWFFGGWKPSARFSAASIRGMAGYSSRILATDLINAVYNNVPQFIIGRGDRASLGFYDQARKLKDLPVTSAMNAMQAVTFPALSNLKDDDRKFADSVGKVVSSITFIMFPMIAGLIVVAADFFRLFLKPDWFGAVPFFRILALTGLFVPVAIIFHNVMKSRSDGRAVMRSEIIKKIVATAVFAATIPFGAVAIAWGMAGIAFTDMAVSFGLGKRYCDYGARRLAADTIPTLGLAVVMAAAVWGLGVLIPECPLWSVLTLKILAGVAVYMGGAALLRLDGFGEFMAVFHKIFGRTA